MDYSQFTKKITLPDGFNARTELIFEDLVAKPLTRADLKADLEGVNSSIETIQRTRGGSWPKEQLSEEFDLLDLAWHEREFRDGNSFAYVIYDTEDTYVGCFYLYPLGVRTKLSEALLDYDVDVSWWVTTDSYEKGHYEKLYKALQQWLTKDLPFNKVRYSNKVIPS